MRWWNTERSDRRLQEAETDPEACLMRSNQTLERLTVSNGSFGWVDHMTGQGNMNRAWRCSAMFPDIWPIDEEHFGAPIL